jgi:hypothetical protein
MKINIYPNGEIISLKSENGSDVAKNNSKEVEKLIKQRKDKLE